MNRLHLVALAAALSTFALACEENVTEIYEPAPPAAVSEGNEKINSTITEDNLDLNFPVPAAADEAIDHVTIETVDLNADILNGGILNPLDVLPPVYDPTRVEQVNSDGSITKGPIEVIDPHDVTYVPSLNPLYSPDELPSRAIAQTQIEGIPPLGQ